MIARNIPAVPGLTCRRADGAWLHARTKARVWPGPPAGAAIGRPNEIARGVRLLMTNEYINGNGEVLHLDGGGRSI